MVTRPDWVPEGLDLDVPSVARVYDYVLGGAHNFAVDREFAREFLAAMPDAKLISQANRAFLHRALRFMIGEGVRQFLDIGSGLPTVGYVHEVAQAIAPESRVVYVDVDPVAVAHSELILRTNKLATAIQEDLRHPDAILDHPETRALLDFSEPVGLILTSILPAIPDDDDPEAILATLRRALCPGSYVVISHVTADTRPDEMDEAARLTKKTTTPVTLRDRAHITRFFAGLELVDPGVVWMTQWRPDHPDDVGAHPERLSNYAGVGRRT